MIPKDPRTAVPPGEIAERGGRRERTVVLSPDDVCVESVEWCDSVAFSCGFRIIGRSRFECV